MANDNDDKTFWGAPRWFWDKVFMVILASPLLYNTHATQVAVEKNGADNKVHSDELLAKQDHQLRATMVVQERLTENTLVAIEAKEATKEIPKAAVIAAEKLIEQKKASALE